MANANSNPPPRNPLLHARFATTVSKSLRDTADECGLHQPAIKARLITAATTIDILVELLISAIATKGVRRYGR